MFAVGVLLHKAESVTKLSERSAGSVIVTVATAVQLFISVIVTECTPAPKPPVV
jgi:hypothetical protein